MRCRHELFGLRDSLRSEPLDVAQGFDARAFEELEGFLNAAIFLVPRLSYSYIRRMLAVVAKNPKLQERVQASQQRMDSVQVQAVADIREECSKIQSRAILANHLGWAPYVVVLAMTVVLYFALRKMFFYVKDMPKQIMGISDDTLQALAGNCGTPSAV